MKIDAQTAARTVDYLKRTIPRGHVEADELVKLIKLFEQAQRPKVSHH